MDLYAKNNKCSKTELWPTTKDTHGGKFGIHAVVYHRYSTYWLYTALVHFGSWACSCIKHQALHILSASIVIRQSHNSAHKRPGASGCRSI